MSPLIGIFYSLISQPDPKDILVCYLCSRKWGRGVRNYVLAEIGGLEFLQRTYMASSLSLSLLFFGTRASKMLQESKRPSVELSLATHSCISLTMTELCFRRDCIYLWNEGRDSSWLSFLSQIKFIILTPPFW